MKNKSATPFCTREIDLPIYEELVLHPLSDLHVGAEGHREQLLLDRIQKIADSPPNHRVLIMGDAADAAIRDSVGHQHGGVSPQTEVDYLCETLKPIADRIDVMFKGNHENRIWKATGIDIMAQIATIIGRSETYRPVATVLLYRWMGWSTGKRPINYRAVAQVFAHHGFGGGRKPGGKINRLMDLALIKPDCNVYMMGHTHENAARVDTTIVGWPPKELRRLFVATSSYVGAEKYAIDAGFSPPSPGSPTVILTCKRATKRERGVRVQDTRIIQARVELT